MPLDDPRTTMPADLADRAELALDLRWTSRPESDRAWRAIDPDAWEHTRNPWLVLQAAPWERVRDADELARLAALRRTALARETWFDGRFAAPGAVRPRRVALFSMEFGLGEALPIYSGGLGVLAGDHLKAASDLGVPTVGVGLLYRQGAFRQVLAGDGTQIEAYPVSDPDTLPILPVRRRDGSRLEIALELPGRNLKLHAWRVAVGRSTLLLLDANHPLNAPLDRGITSRLYVDAGEQRLLQEVVLAVGGWRLLRELDLAPEVCHLNEGHAAFVVWARAADLARRRGTTFDEALAATRPGNVFTTHTPVDAAFDRFDPRLMAPYLHALARLVWQPEQRLLAMGRVRADDPNEPFNMALLALRGCGHVNAVSRLHARVSRELLAPAFARRPPLDVPVRPIVNGVDLAGWTGPVAAGLWREAAGDDWHRELRRAAERIAAVSAERLWDMRCRARRRFVDYVRRRAVRQAREHGADARAIDRARSVLDPDALILGFARRFTPYKRADLLLRDPSRLVRFLRGDVHGRDHRGACLVLAGKAHPNDAAGRALVAEAARFAARPDVAGRVVFLEDHDLALAAELAAGVDVWLNTPVRGMEACGTSGMKILANGGLHLSVLDGWWDEAAPVDPADPDGAGDADRTPGWSLGDRRMPPADDVALAGELYRLLETQVRRDFEDRDAAGVPRRFVERIRASMTTLVPRFTAARMVREHVEHQYVPAARALRRRAAGDLRIAREIAAWRRRIEDGFGSVHVLGCSVERRGGDWHVEVTVDLDGLAPADVRVELYAEPAPGETAATIVPMRAATEPGDEAARRFVAVVPAERPREHWTPRIVPAHPEAIDVLEAPEILWLD